MSHVSEWTITVHLYDDGNRTDARAVLDTGVRTLTGKSSAPDKPAPEVATELATSRALIALGEQLAALATRDAIALGNADEVIFSGR
ncbi:MAG TPA: dsRBD fold-containing protein [Jatrophihabitantaceae bacterium]|nr:dsRBD fold-containing protein [Jatrophihabitantaceae bacterium]